MDGYKNGRLHVVTPADVSRYMLRGVVMGYLNTRFPKWAAVDAALSSEGWKLVTLLRLSPVVPWNVLNYALSVTGESSSSVLVYFRARQIHFSPPWALHNLHQS